MLSRYLGRIPTALAGFAVVSLIASLSWLLVEKPILSLSATHRGAAVR